MCDTHTYKKCDEYIIQSKKTPKWFIDKYDGNFNTVYDND